MSSTKATDNKIQNTCLEAEDPRTSNLAIREGRVGAESIKDGTNLGKHVTDRLRVSCGRKQRARTAPLHKGQPAAEIPSPQNAGCVEVPSADVPCTKYSDVALANPSIVNISFLVGETCTEVPQHKPSIHAHISSDREETEMCLAEHQKHKTCSTKKSIKAVIGQPERVRKDRIVPPEDFNKHFNELRRQWSITSKLGNQNNGNEPAAQNRNVKQDKALHFQPPMEARLEKENKDVEEPTGTSFNTVLDHVGAVMGTSSDQSFYDVSEMEETKENSSIGSADEGTGNLTPDGTGVVKNDESLKCSGDGDYIQTHPEGQSPVLKEQQDAKLHKQRGSEQKEYEGHRKMPEVVQRISKEFSDNMTQTSDSCCRMSVASPVVSSNVKLETLEDNTVVINASTTWNKKAMIDPTPPQDNSRLVWNVRIPPKGPLQFSVNEDPTLSLTLSGQQRTLNLPQQPSKLSLCESSSQCNISPTEDAVIPSGEPIIKKHSCQETGPDNVSKKHSKVNATHAQSTKHAPVRNVTHACKEVPGPTDRRERTCHRTSSPHKDAASISAPARSSRPRAGVAHSTSPSPGGSSPSSKDHASSCPSRRTASSAACLHSPTVAPVNTTGSRSIARLSSNSPVSSAKKTSTSAISIRSCTKASPGTLKPSSKRNTHSATSTSATSRVGNEPVLTSPSSSPNTSSPMRSPSLPPNITTNVVKSNETATFNKQPCQKLVVTKKSGASTLKRHSCYPSDIDYECSEARK